MIRTLLFILGAVAGSFSGCIIYRLPKSVGFIRGNSRCPHCGERIRFFDLIPIVSILLLGFRCRYCRRKISPVYLIVEVISALGWLLSYKILVEHGVVIWLFTIVIFQTILVLSVIDYQNLIIPDKIILFLLLLVAVFGIYFLATSNDHYKIFSLNSLLGALITATPLFSVWLVSRGNSMGLGDIKLALILGLIFGIWGGLSILFIAFLIGALTSIVLLAINKAGPKTKLPLGTFIGVSVMIFLFWGEIISQYLHF